MIICIIYPQKTKWSVCKVKVFSDLIYKSFFRIAQCKLDAVLQTKFHYVEKKKKGWLSHKNLNLLGSFTNKNSSKMSLSIVKTILYMYLILSLALIKDSIDTLFYKIYDWKHNENKIMLIKFLYLVVLTVNSLFHNITISLVEVIILLEYLLHTSEYMLLNFFT